MLIIVLSAGLSAKLMYSDKKWEAILGGLFGMAIGAVISIFVFVFTYLFIDGNANKIQIVDYTENIYSLQDNIGIEGRFYLGAGRISDDLKYYYIVKNNNQIKIKSIDNSDDLIIEESDTETPQVIHYKYKFTNKIIENNFNASGEAIKIVIPKGSIKYDFNMDLK
jgi:uncharacterized membrane protein